MTGGSHLNIRDARVERGGGAHCQTSEPMSELLGVVKVVVRLGNADELDAASQLLVGGGASVLDAIHGTEANLAGVPFDSLV
jgi:hypothetical protein